MHILGSAAVAVEADGAPRGLKALLVLGVQGPAQGQEKQQGDGDGECGQC